MRLPIRHAAALVLATGASAAVAVVASADSTPVGPLPSGPKQSLTVDRGERVSMALPRHSEASGLVWRVARSIDGDVLEQIGEGEIGKSVVLVFRAKGSGKATVRFALTKGDSSPEARASRTFTVKVR